MARPFTVRAVQSKKDGKWRTQMKGGNGETIMGGQDYAHKGNADRAALRISKAAIVYLPPKEAK